MGKPRNLTLRLKVDEVLQRHACQHNENHVLRKGDVRLKVTVGRTDEHYCAPCAHRFIKASIARLEAIDRDLQEAEAARATAATHPGEAPS